MGNFDPGRDRDERTESSQVVEILKPTASKMPYNVLNPFIYRMVDDAGSLEAIATLLEARQDWRDRCDELVRDPGINAQLDNFRTLGEDTQ